MILFLFYLHIFSIKPIKVEFCLATSGQSPGLVDSGSLSWHTGTPVMFPVTPVVFLWWGIGFLPERSSNQQEELKTPVWHFHLLFAHAVPFPREQKEQEEQKQCYNYLL